jgi:formate dehydrogenase iron-sulfur subunit
VSPAGDLARASLDELTPIDRYLAEQADLTPVERFARRSVDDHLPAQARYYRDLVPLSRPGPGQQYGFAVDLDACTGCKACVTACHRMNGLDDGESWRSVGVVAGGGAERPHQQTVTASCHHCVDPGCLKGCPANAYAKDPVTGIVVHLDESCIGCRYCTLTCPYEVPRYNSERGIVRKCDLCTDRLAAGEAPACVQACPNGAIAVELVEVAAAREAAGGTLVAGAPPSSTTVPTTSYRSARPPSTPAALPAAAPAGRGQAHPPLAVMLVLTQLAVGTSVVGLALAASTGRSLAGASRPANAVVALAVGLLALAASVLHLGRPERALRAVLGVRRSWLSREIVAFGAFSALAAAHAWSVLTGTGAPLETLLGALAALAGVAGVACSVLVYAVTARAWWSAPTAGVKFTLTALASGSATALVVGLGSSLAAGTTGAGAVASGPVAALALLAAGATGLQLAFEAAGLRHLRPGAPAELRRTTVLLTRELRVQTQWRFATGGLGALALLAVAPATASGATPVTGLAVALVALAVVLAGQLIERSQFFTAVAPPRMPGHPA